MTNNLNKPLLEAEADSVRRLGEHLELIADPAVRAFVERVKARVGQLRAEEAEGKGKEGAEVMIIKSGNDVRAKN